MAEIKTEWSPQELHEIADWAKGQGGNVGQAAIRYLKAVECLKNELTKMAKQTQDWAAKLS